MQQLELSAALLHRAEAGDEHPETGAVDPLHIFEIDQQLVLSAIEQGLNRVLEHLGIQPASHLPVDVEHDDVTDLALPDRHSWAPGARRRSMARIREKSSGRGDSNTISVPVAGCWKDTRVACSAWRGIDWSACLATTLRPAGSRVKHEFLPP